MDDELLLTGKELRIARLGVGFTVMAMSRAAKVGVEQIVDWETEAAAPSMIEQLAILDAIGVLDPAYRAEPVRPSFAPRSVGIEPA